MSSRDLFGGALKATLPRDLIDASGLRQVPDTQEVFLYPDSNISIIVEVLEKAVPTDYKSAASFHFGSLAHDNDAESHNVESTTIIPNDRGDNTPSPVVIVGTQQIKKFNRPIPDDVRIFLALYRVESKNVDLVLSMNVPLRTSDGQSVPESDQTAARQVFDTAVRSLRIVDFGLFA